MAGADASSDVPHHALVASAQIPIAQLGPHLDDTARWSVRGVITIVWPYSIITKSLSFQLAEPDFRLRRQKGQVRVTFTGACAKAVADASIEGGDEILLSLDGVEWVENDAPGRIPGATLEWQAKFPTKALLQVTGDQRPTPKTISVDGADAEPNGTDPPAIARAIAFSEMIVDDAPSKTPSPPPEPVRPSKRPLSRDLDADEYASPAFIKRARMSYGSLFEGGLNIFEEDDKPRGRRRRRTTFGRSSNGWRYTSQSRSPEPEQESVGSERSEDVEEQLPSAVTGDEQKPQTADEGCQTSDKDTSSSPSPTIKKPLGSKEQPSTDAPEEPTVDQTQEIATTRYGTLGTEEHTDASDIQYPHAQREPTAEESTPLAPNRLDTLPVEAPVYPDHYTLDPMGHQPLSEPDNAGMHVTQTGFSDQGVLWGHAGPYPPLETGHEVQPNPFLMHTPTQYPDFPDPFRAPIADEAASSLMHQPMQAFTDPKADRNRIGSNDAEPYVIDSDAESVADQAEDSEDRVGHGEVRTAFADNIKALVGGPAEDSVGATVDPEGEPDEADVSESGRLADEGAKVDFDTDDEEPGGDYDTRKYSKPQDDDDGSLDSDVDEEDDEMEVDEDEMQPGIHDESGEEYDERLDYEQGGYEDEEGYGEEGYGEETGSEQEGLDDEEESEEEEDEREDLAPPDPFKPSPAPVFIDLISDSEDEDQEPAPGKHVTEAIPSSPPNNRHDAAAGKGTMGHDGTEEESLASEAGSRSVRPSAKSSSPHPPASFLVNAAAEKKLELTTEDLPSVEPEPQSKPGGGETAEKQDVGEKPPSLAKTMISHSVHPDDAQTSSEASVIDDAQLAPPAPETVGTEAQPPLRELRDADTYMEDAGPQSSPRLLSDTELPEGAKAQPSPRELGDADVDMAHAEAQHRSHALEDAGSEGVAEDKPDVRAQEDTDRASIVHMDTRSTGKTEEARPSLQVKESPDEQMKDAEAEAHGDAEHSQDAEVGATPSSAKEDIDEHMDEGSASELIKQQLEGEQEHEDDESIAEEQITVADDETVCSEAQSPEQDVGEALASPPLTQATKVPDMEDAEHIEGSQETGAKDQLPTPHDTQLEQTMGDPGEASDHEGDSVTVTTLETTVEAKTPQSSRSRKKAESVDTAETPSRRRKRRGDTVSTESQPSQATEGTGQSLESISPLMLEGFAITLKSLRDRREQRKTVTASQEPSARLAARRTSEASPPQPTRVTEASPGRRNKQTEASPPKHRATRSRTRSVQLSASPEPRGSSRLQSMEPPPPSPKVKSTAGNAKGAHPSVKQLTTSLRTTAPNLTALRSLRGHVNKTVDVMGVVTMQPPNPQRPKNGPRDYLLSFSITDQSAAPTHVVAVQVFRPHRDSLPVVREGDVILLREFAVAGIRGRDFGLRSGEASSWAVFERGREDGLPQIRGPPVEVSKGEVAHGELLAQWYEVLDGKAREKLGKANERMEEAGQG